MESYIAMLLTASAICAQNVDMDVALFLVYSEQAIANTLLLWNWFKTSNIFTNKIAWKVTYT